jgi:probable F420-dependent oxidoreductase
MDTALPSVGITIFPTDRTLPPATIAREVEARGFESLFLPEHSHIPTSRDTMWPGAVPGDEDLPDYYSHINDQIVSLSMAAAVTSSLRLGTAVNLVPQHDPVWLAKQIATLDHLSGGRVVLGVGFAWNQEQCENHGVDFARRREITRDNVAIMRSLWSDAEAAYSGSTRSLTPSWAHPKPAQSGGPPILLGGGWGPKLMAHLCEWADGWMPISSRGSLASRLEILHESARTHGRDPSTLSVTVMGASEDPADLENLAAEGVDRVVWTIWSEDPEDVMTELDRLASILDLMA